MTLKSVTWSSFENEDLIRLYPKDGNGQFLTVKAPRESGGNEPLPKLVQFRDRVYIQEPFNTRSYHENALIFIHEDALKL